MKYGWVWLLSALAAGLPAHAQQKTGPGITGDDSLTWHGITLYGDGSREALFLSIAFGRQGVCPAWIKKMSAAAIRETAVYVYSISHRDEVPNAD